MSYRHYIQNAREANRVGPARPDCANCGMSRSFHDSTLNKCDNYSPKKDDK